MINYKKLTLSFLGPFLSALVGSFFTFDAVKNWYPFINKSFFNPPNWIFAPVWTTLYFLMGVSFYLIWVKKPKKELFKKITYLFIAQLILNSLWSILFFGFNLLWLSVLEIIVFWFVLLGMIYLMFKSNKNAAYLQIPYLLWCSFASLLTLSIALLN
jgi:benzodiazapine receptor